MMMDLNQIALFAQYNHWMNIRLYAAAEKLPTAALFADRKAFFGSLFGTLNHLVVADTIWLKRFACHPARYTVLDAVSSLPMPTRLDERLFDDFAGLHQRRVWLVGEIERRTEQAKAEHLAVTLCYTNMKGVES